MEIDSIIFLFIVKMDFSCLLFTNMTAQPEHSSLVEMDSIIFLFIVYRYDNTAVTFTVLPGGDGDYYIYVYCYRYDNTTGTFTVPPGGDGTYYFFTFLTVFGQSYFDVEINGELICTVSSNLTQTSEFEITSCNGAAYAVEGIHKDLKV